MASFGYYDDVKELSDGRLAAVVPFLFTHGLCVGIEPSGESHRTRYCYTTKESADDALASWDGEGDPPGPWIKQKPEDRSNPALNDPYA